MFEFVPSKSEIDLLYPFCDIHPFFRMYLSGSNDGGKTTLWARTFFSLGWHNIYTTNFILFFMFHRGYKHNSFSIISQRLTLRFTMYPGNKIKFPKQFVSFRIAFGRYNLFLSLGIFFKDPWSFFKLKKYLWRTLLDLLIVDLHRQGETVDIWFIRGMERNRVVILFL